MTEYKSKKSLEKLSQILKSNKSLQKETFEKLNANVLFEISNKKDKVIWILNSKDEHNIELKNINSSDNSPHSNDILIKIDDNNLKKLINGKQSAQKLFMIGKLKIKGNVMKASYIEKLLKFAGNEKAKL
ncbi:hypothetical protein C6P40_005133 [Pichia californica]|uniref:SCP2 domain-containing protein n=1 Tax=Pichia californica TaxID=460514 RepID=A0A9P6WFB9_9ASCO|nr:hypothetical protein C6P42_004521 [[Candida] californica]KAG0683952.1 hypothetical protein C6P40_005133 [[Candida] californica]